MCVLVGGAASKPRCRWGDESAGFIEGPRGLTLAMYDNTSEADCKDLCEHRNDCKSITLDREVRNGSMSCELIRCGVECGMTLNSDCHNAGTCASHFDCNEQPVMLIAGVSVLCAVMGLTAVVTMHCLAIRGDCAAVLVEFPLQLLLGFLASCRWWYRQVQRHVQNLP